MSRDYAKEKIVLCVNGIIDATTNCMVITDSSIVLVIIIMATMKESPNGSLSITNKENSDIHYIPASRYMYINV